MKFHICLPAQFMDTTLILESLKAQFAFYFIPKYTLFYCQGNITCMNLANLLDLIICKIGINNGCIG